MYRVVVTTNENNELDELDELDRVFETSVRNKPTTVPTAVLVNNHEEYRANSVPVVDNKCATCLPSIFKKKPVIAVPYQVAPQPYSRIGPITSKTPGGKNTTKKYNTRFKKKYKTTQKKARPKKITRRYKKQRNNTKKKKN